MSHSRALDWHPSACVVTEKTSQNLLTCQSFHTFLHNKWSIRLTILSQLQLNLNLFPCRVLKNEEMNSFRHYEDSSCRGILATSISNFSTNPSFGNLTECGFLHDSRALLCETGSLISEILTHFTSKHFKTKSDRKSSNFKILWAISVLCGQKSGNKLISPLHLLKAKDIHSCLLKTICHGNERK